MTHSKIDFISIYNMVKIKRPKNFKPHQKDADIIQQEVLALIGLDRYDLIYILKQRSWVAIGLNSAYAKVLQSPCKRFVLRISVSHDNYGYYASHAVGNVSNPYIPAVYWHMHAVQKSGSSITLIEALKEANIAPNDTRNKDFNLIQKALPQHKSILNITRDLGNKPQLQKALKSVVRLVQKYNLQSDIHHQNIMLRGQQLVITDPIS